MTIDEICAGRDKTALNSAAMDLLFLQAAREIISNTAHGAGITSVLLALRAILESISRVVPRQNEHDSVQAIRYAYTQLGGR